METRKPFHVTSSEISSAVYVLTNDAASIDEKMVALRQLKHYLASDSKEVIDEDAHWRSSRQSTATAAAATPTTKTTKTKEAVLLEDDFEYDLNEFRDINTSAVAHFAEQISHEPAGLSFYNRKRISQLVLDNVLKIILAVDSTLSGRKRQLIRTELFVCLATLMQSTTLFGDIAEKIEQIEERNEIYAEEKAAIAAAHRNDDRHSDDEDEDGDDAPSESFDVSDYSYAAMFKVDANDLSRHTQSAASAHRPLIELSTTNGSTSFSDSVGPPLTIKSAWEDGDSDGFGPARELLASLSNTANTAQTKKPLQVLKQLQVKALKTKSTNKKFKPRASVLFSDKLERDAYVPGTDPFNFLEQDRKLGYQISRMWFPAAEQSLRNSLLPDIRSNMSAKESMSEQIVQEFQKMRALASYMGDLVMPYDSQRGQHQKQQKQQKGEVKGAGKGGGIELQTSPKRRLAGVTDPRLFNRIMAESLSIWSPLVGVQIPVTHFSGSGDAEGGPLSLRNGGGYGSSSGSGAATERQVADRQYDTLKPFKNLADARKKAEKKRRKRQGRDVWTEDDNDDNDDNDDDDNDQHGAMQRKITTYQNEQMDIIALKRSDLEASVIASKAEVHKFVDKQYQLFPPRFILLLEGEDARARKVIARATNIFVKTLLRGMLSLGFAQLRINVVRQKSLEARPVYARTAAVYLIVSWVDGIRVKNIGKWVQRWRLATSWDTFSTRHLASLRIQTLYRVWRDRRKIVRMHLAGPYLGPLSDIELGAFRPAIRFAIPQSIRINRRMYWLAAKKVQTRYRSWIEGRDYIDARKKLKLVQSIARMWPIYCKFQRLRFTTVCAQKWTRRTVKRNHFRLMRHSCIILQKYVRRLLGQLRRARVEDLKWRMVGFQEAKIIEFQCRVREKFARKRCAAIRFRNDLLHWAALVVQRNWYRIKRALHTFVLMCAYRVRQVEDEHLDALSYTMGYRQAARRLQRFYKMRYFKRNITGVCKVQCWFRGRLGFSFVGTLRKQRWAARKLHHWARGMMKRKHAYVRKIQLLWWRCKPFRLLHHLWHRAYLRDVADNERTWKRRHEGAARIQASMKGIWDRRWVVRTRAASIIQRNYRFLMGIKRWKKMKREANLAHIRRYVLKITNKGVADRTRELVALHSRMLIRPQALIRRFLVRAVFDRVRRHAYRLGLATVIIQRFWRKSGAMSNAVEEVMALKRMKENPFRRCAGLTHVLEVLRQMTRESFSVTDPRAGMRTTDLLNRLGCPELSEMFNRKDHLFVRNLRHLTVDRLTMMYDSWVKRRDVAKAKEDAKKGLETKKEKKSKRKAKSNAPVHIFQLLLNIARPKLFANTPELRRKLKDIVAIAEAHSPSDIMLTVQTTFSAKFGKNLQTRCQHIGEDVISLSWSLFNNYKTFGSSVITRAQVLHALDLAAESSAVITTLGRIRDSTTGGEDRNPVLKKISDEDREWDLARVTKTAEVLQLAADYALSILPPDGVLHRMLSKAGHKVVNYRRKMQFLRTRVQHGGFDVVNTEHSGPGGFLINLKGHGQSHDSHTVGGPGHSGPSNASKGGAKGKVVMTAGAATAAHVATGAESAIAHHLHFSSERMSIAQTVDATFSGKTFRDMQLEEQTSVCKLYFEAFDALTHANSAIQSIKNNWSNNAMRRAINREKERLYLEARTAEYLADRKVNLVQATWNKHKRTELLAKRTEVIVEAARQRRYDVELALAEVCRHDWEYVVDEDNYGYYVDMSPVPMESSYEKPVYSFWQWRAACALQKWSRPILRAAIQARLEKAEAERLEIERAQAELERELELARRPIRTRFTLILPSLKRVQPIAKDAEVKITILGQTPTAALATTAAARGAKIMLPVSQLVPALEDLLPWRLRLQSSVPTLSKSGNWALYLRPGPALATDAAAGFSSVVLCGLNNKTKTCRIRTTKGTKLADIPLDRIYHLSYDVGATVEARQYGRKVFYAAVVSRIEEEASPPTYSVRYEDGEEESGLDRCLLRPTAALLKSLERERKTLLPALMQRRNRMLHFAEMKRQRIEKVVGASAQAAAVAAAVSRLDSGDKDTMGYRPGTSSGRMGVSSAVSKAKSPRAGEPPAQLVAFSKGEPETGTVETNLPKLPTTRVELKISIRDRQIPLVFGWSCVGERGRGDEYYTSEFSDEQLDYEPVYPAAMSFMAAKIQSCWLLKSARLKVRRRVLTLSVVSVARVACERSRRVAYVGFKLEGLTIQQLLRRVGKWELSDVIEGYYKTMKITKQLTHLTLEKVATWPVKEYEKIGVVQTSHVRALRDLQAWWLRYPPAERERRLMLFNYFDSPFDTRSIQKCIYDREDELTQMFLKHFTSNTSRTRAVLKSLVEEATFPHSYQQVESYVMRYKDKPELAREMITELLQKATTHTGVAETEALRVLRHGVHVLCAVLRGLGLHSLHERFFALGLQADRIATAEEILFDPVAERLAADTAANAIAATAVGKSAKKGNRPGSRPASPDSDIPPPLGAVAVAEDAKAALSAPAKKVRVKEGKDKPRVPCTGQAAKAGLLLRREVLQVMLDYSHAAVQIQRIVRGYFPCKKWRSFSDRRAKAVDKAQRCIRRYLAYCVARHLRKEQASPWEQLWDAKRQMLYYYNWVKDKSSYEEPPIDEQPFRPLVRDRMSAALVQAWPHLNNRGSGGALIPTGHLRLVTSSTTCKVCAVRGCVRACLDCYDQETYDENLQTSSYPYCFPCFSKEHQESGPLGMHRYRVVEPKGLMTGELVPEEADEEYDEQTGELLPRPRPPSRDEKMLLPPRLYLRCCVCDEPATRKCLGILDDQQIDEVCSKLKRAPADQWKATLLEANVGGEHKLNRLLDEIVAEENEKRGDGNKRSPEKKKAALEKKMEKDVRAKENKAAQGDEEVKDAGNQSPAATTTTTVAATATTAAAPSSSFATLTARGALTLSAPQLQMIRMLLEQTRAECDENYCSFHYVEQHSGGRRQLHRYASYSARALICCVCKNSPAEQECVDCQCEYCHSCFKVFHQMGRKKRHLKQTIVEELSEGQRLCRVCKQRCAVAACANGDKCCDRRMRVYNSEDGTDYCECCLEYKHQAKCNRVVESEGVAGTGSSAEEVDSAKTLSRAKTHTHLCAACGERADQYCMQCGDFYCSHTRMGHAGCFMQFHARGNRASHVTKDVARLLPEDFKEAYDRKKGNIARGLK